MIEKQKQTQQTSSEMDSKKYSEIDIEQQICGQKQIMLDRYDKCNSQQIFYKQYVQKLQKQIILIHGYKVFSIKKCEEDLVGFCLSLLQFQASFPIKFYFTEQINKDNKGKIRDVWLETSFLMTGDNLLQQSEKQLENKIYRFFNESLLPLLVKFKQQKMNWSYMITKQYTDQKVIEEFQETVINQITNSFKSYCKYT